jgi:hypothetical protein
VGDGIPTHPVIEGAARTWSINLQRESLSLPAWLEALAPTTFLVAMVLGRLAGDSRSLFWPCGSRPGRAPGRDRLSRGSRFRTGLRVRSAARVGDQPASENVAAMTMVSVLVVLRMPTLLGYLAEAWGVRAIFMAVVPLALLSLAVSRILTLVNRP